MEFSIMNGGGSAGTDYSAISVQGTLDVTASPGTPFTMRYAVNFEQATVDYDLSRPKPLMLYQDEKATPVEHAGETGYLGEIRYFLDCVANRRRPRLVTADDAVAGLRIAEAEKRSIETGRVVAL